MRAHQIDNGVVINTVVVDSLDFLPNLIEATEGGIGWTWDGTTLTAPPPPPIPIPTIVTMRQARLALLGAGVLDTTDAAIAAMPGIEGQAARIEWEYAHEIRRDSPIVAAMSAMLGLDDAALDGLFLQASTL